MANVNQREEILCPYCNSEQLHLEYDGALCMDEELVECIKCNEMFKVIVEINISLMTSKNF